MNGAECLVRRLMASGVEVCFGNPGTSEMHFLAALDRIDGLRSVLCLFEGVATGAADGYARMTGKPAATLTHLGPGLANGLANLHNARRARSPVVNIIGDHATYHRQYDSPLTSDVEAVASTFSDWVRTSPTAASLAEDAAAAVLAARTPPGKVASLILPADTAWGGAATEVDMIPNWPSPVDVPDDRVDDVAEVLRGDDKCLLYITDKALTERGLDAASRIAQATGADLLTPVSNARIERGAGRVAIERLSYPVDQALEQLKPYKHIILVGAAEPVAFFAYPDKPSRLAAEGATCQVLAAAGEDLPGALEQLAERLGAAKLAPHHQRLERPSAPSGPLAGDKIATAVAHHLPENAIVVDESISTGRHFFPYTRTAAPHTWLQIIGGAIGTGLPLAVGAAVACPERKVISLQADGSAMYTIQALWTQAREGLDVTTVILSNRAYAILQGEMTNVGVANPGPTGKSMMSLDDPPLDWVALAKGMGIEAVATGDAADFTQALGRGVATPGPFLIEARI
ncbi:MAG: acetolactate synthase large subunit [Alphaproteobacteria bacterium]|nr:acetolactate synthase large subunit [Alphaproteobacteria bacterium]